MGPGLGAARQSGNGCEDQRDTANATFHLRLPTVTRKRRAHPLRPRTANAPRTDSLLRRYEALRRVLANPAPTIARLALKLHALGARAYAIARRIALHRPRAEPRDPKLFAHACVRASDAIAESG